jgi:hypothetical protein
MKWLAKSQIQEAENFGADFTPELRKQEQALRDEIARKW